MPEFTIEQIQERLKKEPCSRKIELEPEDLITQTEDLVLPFSCSSEYPVRRWYGYEILDHKRNAVDFSRFKDGAAVVDTHWGDQVGAIMDPKLDTELRKTRCNVKFSRDNERAVLLYNDYKNKIRRNVSVAYDVLEMVLEKEVDQIPYYRITKWQPIHLALLPDGADPTVGSERGIGKEPKIIPLNLDENPKDQIEKFNREFGNELKIQLITNQRSKSMPPEVLTPEEIEAEKVATRAKIDAAIKEAGEKEGARIANISAAARDFKPQCPHLDLEKEATKFIEDRTKSYEDFFTFIRTEMKKPEALRTPDSRVGLNDKETNAYSIRNIILYQLGKLPEEDVKLELEAHRALVKKNKLHPQHERGVFLPDEIQNRRRMQRVSNLSHAQRDLLVGTDASGGYLVKDQYISASFIEILQNAMIAKAAGVDVLTGFIGDIPMNRELDNYTYYHVGEGSGPTKSSITFSQEKMTPKKAGCLAKYSYEFLMQQSGLPTGVEAYVEKKLAIACALGADRDIFYGTGSNYQPKGLKLWTGVGAVDGASFTRTKALTMEGQLYTGNAQDLGSMAFISKGSTRSVLKGKVIDAGSGKFLVDDNNTMIGYDYKNVSNQIDAGDLFFGIWNQILVGFWNQIEIAANPYGDTEFAAGDVKVRALQALDVFVLNPAAFSYASGVN